MMVPRQTMMGRVCSAWGERGGERRGEDGPVLEEKTPCARESSSDDEQAWARLEENEEDDDGIG